MGQTHRVTGANDVGLSVYECGNPDGQAILLIHGLFQCCLSWNYQFDSALADEFRIVAMDLRGHGMTDKPTDTESYTIGQYWADDVASVIDQLELKKPVLAGWSYGGLVIGDYLQCYGDGKIGGINFAGAAATLGTEEAKTLIGPKVMELIPGFMSEDLSESIAATRDFVILCSAEPPSDKDRELALAYNMMVPLQVRRDAFSREVHFGEVLKSVTVPTLVTQGTEDQMATPPMAKIFLNSIPHAVESVYEGVGHAPFMEDAERFNRELGELARSVANS
ncbi:MAG TPA: alpha/beta hydrolase [Sneathiellales bacterium]|nr:alpha/beta hydrolase [Sneathiellales bacterium]